MTIVNYTNVQYMIILSNSVRRMIPKVRHVTALAVRVLDRLLRDNPFTYLPSQTAQMGERREECWGRLT